MITEASTLVSIRIAGGSDKDIDRYELVSARRALRLLKRNLGHDRLHDLVRGDIAEGNAFFRDHVKRSGGRQATGTITIEASNLAAADFSEWMIRAFARRDLLIDAQPEHYLMDMADPSGPHVVETLGEHVVGFYMGGWDDSQVDADEPAGTEKRRSLLKLDDDGTVFGSVSTAFLEAQHGMTAELSVTLPATTAPEAIEQHLQHFSVEFRSWMLMAASEIRHQSEPTPSRPAVSTGVP